MTSTWERPSSVIARAAWGASPAATTLTVSTKRRASTAHSSASTCCSSGAAAEAIPEVATEAAPVAADAAMSGMDECPSLKGAAQGDLVGIFEVPTDREAGRQAGDP